LNRPSVRTKVRAHEFVLHDLHTDTNRKGKCTCLETTAYNGCCGKR
jgi:hypothetical protein